jgi:DNA mismatch repair protein MutS2
MRLPIGTAVVVRTFGNKRGVVIAAGRSGRYRVRVEGVAVSCREEDLEVVPEARKKTRRDVAKAPPAAETAPSGRPASRVDLHGLGVEEAIARVVDEIDDALVRGADRIEVIHGKGSGRIRDALHRHLATIPVVKAFGLDKGNPGVTWVWF